MDRTWWRSTQELDEDQRNLIEIPIEDANHLITGPPGCGKTNILLLRASYLRSAGFGNCVVLVFTRSLREFIAAGSSQSSTMLPADRIQTHAEWTISTLRQLGQPFEPSEENLGHDQSRLERNQAIEQAVRESGLNDTYFDSILLDEVQDYWACEVELLSRLTRRLFTVGDFRQRIFDRNEGIQAALDAGCKEMQLRNHYRMGFKICNAADQVLPPTSGDPLERFSQYDERELPSRVSLHSVSDFQEQLSSLKSNLGDQLRAYPGEWLGVFAVRRDTIDTIANFLDQTELKDQVIFQSDDAEDRTYYPERKIVVTTLHSGKGTEFRSVHFLAADDFPYYTREKAFTAVTRAKTTLDVYHSQALNGSLESALSSPTVPDLDRILR